MAEDDIESYWDEIRPSRESTDPLEVIMSEEDVGPPAPSHPAIRPMIMSREAFEDILTYSRAERAPSERHQSFHNLEDELPLQDLRVALQTLGYDCETWINEEGRLCIQLHGLVLEVGVRNGS